MLAKKITYPNFEGEMVTETFYFNLTRAEIAEMEMNHPGGYSKYLEQIIDSKDTNEIMKLLTQLILDSYGEKTPDGRYFEKSKQISDRFHTSEAYSVLLMSMLENADFAAEFINGIVPDAGVDESQKQKIIDDTKKRIEEKKQQGVE